MNILRCKEVEKKVGLKQAKIYLLVKEGVFPLPIKLSTRTVGWVESELDDWLNEKIKERDALRA